MGGGTRPAKALYVGFDACDAPTMLELAAAGRCPNLAGLLARSAVVDTVAPFGTFVGSSWMTISTGMDVGTHDYWNWVEVDPSTAATVGTTPRSVRSAPFWQRLSDSGHHVAVIDVPHLGLPERFNGIVLKEWGCHDRHDGTASFPATVLDDLDREFGRHPVGGRDHPLGHDAFAPCDYTLRAQRLRTPDEERQFLTLLREGVERKRRASLRLLDLGGWDLFLTVLGEGHCVGHQFWHLHDPTHPRHDAALREQIGDPVEDIYGRLDATLGDLLERVGPDTPVAVQMNHGMGPHFDGTHLLEPVLARLDDEFARRPRLWSRVTALAAKRHRDLAERRRADRRTRKFFPILGNTSVGAVRFNLVGRDAPGRVQPGAELDRLRETLTRELLAIVNLDTGRPFVTNVVRSEEVLTRHEGDRFPDLFVEWDRSSLPERVGSPMIGEIRRPYLDWRTGDHHAGGLFAVSGPGIEPGRRPTPMSLVDSAATVAALMGTTLDGVDSRPRHDLLGTRG